MATIIIVPGVEGLVNEFGSPTSKIAIFDRLAKQINREMYKEGWQVWTHSNYEDNCYRTALALNNLMNSHSLQIISREERLDLKVRDLREKNGRLKKLDTYMLKYATSNSNPGLFVITPEFANIYPTHFWNNILKCNGGVGEIKEGYGVMFKFDGKDGVYEGSPSNCSCKFLG